MLRKRPRPRSLFTVAASLMTLALTGMLAMSQLTAGAANLDESDLELVADLVVTQDGAIIEGLHVVGDIEVQADDVLIRGVRVTSNDPIPIRVDRNARNLLVQDTVVECGNDGPSFGIGNDHYRAERVELVGCDLGFREGVGVEIVDSVVNGQPVPGSTTVPETTTTSEAPASTSVLHWSASPDRSNAAELDGAAVPSELYIFLTSDARNVDSVAWYLDGVLIRDDDLRAPWDMYPAAAGLSGLVELSSSHPTGFLATAVLNYSDGTQEAVNARFAVESESAADGLLANNSGEVTTGAGGGSTNPSSFPDATTTGVQPGVVLQPSGSITVTQDGAVIENLEVSGRIEVRANDVVIRNVIVKGSSSHLIRNRGQNLLVEYVTLLGQEPCAAGIAFTNYTARHVDVSGCADGMKANSNVVIEDSYIHDLRKWTGTHNDGIQGTGGGNLVIRNNRIEGPYRGSVSAIKLDSFNSHLDDVLVEGNLIYGGGYSIYLEAKTGMEPPTNSRIINNVFVRGSMTWDWIRVHTDPTQVISGNVWDDGRPAD